MRWSSAARRLYLHACMPAESLCRECVCVCVCVCVWSRACVASVCLPAGHTLPPPLTPPAGSASQPFSLSASQPLSLCDCHSARHMEAPLR